VAAGSIGVLLELSGVRSAVVSALVVVFLLIAPAAAIAGLLRGFDLLARAVLAAAGAVVMVTAVAMIMLAAGAWSPQAGLVVIAALTAACAAARWRPARLPHGITHLASRAAARAPGVLRRLRPGHPAPGVSRPSR
jgi:hypothetical protein